MVFFTAELSRALAVVMVTLQVSGNSQFSGFLPSYLLNASSYETHHKYSLPLMMLRSLVKRSKSSTDNHRNLVKLIAPESLKASELKCIQIFHIVRP